MSLAATEQNDLPKAVSRLPVEQDFVERLVRRFRPFYDLTPPGRVLDIGAAQGVSMTCFARAGFEVEGLEPWGPAIEVSKALAEETGVPLKIEQGYAEKLPFDDQSFDFVQAYSVMEHVDDPDQVFREVFRVLRPGGAFFFSTSTAICPRQVEIQGFPFFPWYPKAIQRRIMDWAVRERPALVGHTTRPAYQWFRHRQVKAALSAVGFSPLVDRWEFRRGESTGLQRALINAAADHRSVKFFGDLAIPAMEYLAIRPPSN